MKITARAWFRNLKDRNPQPPRAAIKLMLAEIEAGLTRPGWRPVELACECWCTEGEGADGFGYLAAITIIAEPGNPTRSLASWFQWKHPRWRWSTTPLKLNNVIEHIPHAPAWSETMGAIAPGAAS